MKPVPCVIWLTGLSGSGKSSLAQGVHAALAKAGILCSVLDGDVLRQGLCCDLDFSDAARRENVRRVSQVSLLMVDAGLVVVVALISPLKKHRDYARQCIGTPRFIEVYCNCPLSVCEGRDSKGLYAQARAGVLTEFTGISAPYEVPVAPHLVVHTDVTSIASNVEKIMTQLSKVSHQSLLNTRQGQTK